MWSTLIHTTPFGLEKINWEKRSICSRETWKRKGNFLDEEEKNVREGKVGGWLGQVFLIFFYNHAVRVVPK
jgi:hypothetical protein